MFLEYNSRAAFVEARERRVKRKTWPVATSSKTNLRSDFSEFQVTSFNSPPSGANDTESAKIDKI